MEHSKPKVFEYLDLISYLQDYYRWRKASHKDFSYEFWSDELDFKSRSYIRMMILGKTKVSNKFVEAFSKMNFLESSEEEYFFYLVNYSQAKNQKDKKAFSTKLMQILKRQTKQSLLEPEADFISTPLLPRLYTLLGFKDITPTKANLATLMDLSEADIEIFLSTLEGLGLVKRTLVDDEIHWLALHDKFKISDDRGNLNLMRFHEMSLQDAIQAFQQPKNLRKYKSLLLPFSEEELTEFYTLLDDFATEQMARFSASSYKHRRLFQINFNIHAVARELNEDHP